MFLVILVASSLIIDSYSDSVKDEFKVSTQKVVLL